MTALLTADRATGTTRRGPTAAEVRARRGAWALLVVAPVAWASWRAVSGPQDLVNTGGLALVGDLLATALHPQLGAVFLGVVARAVGVTVAFAVLGTAGALLVGAVGGLVLSDVAWGGRPGPLVVAVRVPLRAALVAARSIHELVWALLLVGVLGLDPLVAVIAIAVPFGAQTAKVFADTLDTAPRGPVDALRTSGAATVPALVYGLLPSALPLVLSYSFYRLECAIRSAVVLGVVGVGGLGQELTVSLQSRNWDEVWTLVGAVLVLSAVVDLWSTRVRTALAVVSCTEWSTGRARRQGVRTGSRWPTRSGWAVVPAVVLAWWWSGVSLSGLFSARTHQLAGGLVDDLLPPSLPPGGWAALEGGVLDTLAMAVLAMAIAVVVTVVVGPVAARPRQQEHAAGPLRWLAWGVSRLVLLALRSVPPTVWAVVALLALFPGTLPGAVALGLYTGGILGKLVAEAWESVPARPRAALEAIGVPRPLAALATTAPAGVPPLVSYTLYRFEICVRETAVVGVVGAAGLGRLLEEGLSAFRFSSVTTLLLASLAISLAAEALGRAVRRASAA